MSDDGRSALTIIAMLGNVFSPFYAARRARAPQDPLDHVTLNVALYSLAGGRGLGRRAPRSHAERWALTERNARQTSRDRDHLRIGKSSLERRDDGLVVRIDEVASPLGERVRGTVHVRPRDLFHGPYDLDGRGRHLWTPIAPAARIEATFDDPALRFSGHGYLDANTGEEALEDAFSSWSWSRSAAGPGSQAGHGDEAVHIAYDARLRHGGRTTLGLAFERGRCSAGVPRAVALPRSRWNLPRTAYARLGATDPRIVRTLEDAPFYARTLLQSGGADPRFIVHEELSLDRFRAPWVQFLLPFRMRREIA